jgi:hypothetical protein
VAASSNPVFRPLVRSVLSFYGVLDVSTPAPSKPIRSDLAPDFPYHEAMRRGNYMDRAMGNLVRTYCDDHGAVSRDKRCSPVYMDASEVHSNLTIIAPAWDPLLDEELRLLEKVRGAQVKPDDFLPPLVRQTPSSSGGIIPLLHTMSAELPPRPPTASPLSEKSEGSMLLHHPPRITLHLLPRCTHGWNFLPSFVIGQHGVRAKEAAFEVALESLRLAWRTDNNLKQGTTRS